MLVFTQNDSRQISYECTVTFLEDSAISPSPDYTKWQE